jgi:putative oxidoreductase
MAVDRRRIAPIPLRLIAGIGFIYHGFPKLFSSEGHAEFVNSLDAMGVPLPEVTAWMVGLLEFGGGLALLAGAATLVVSSLLIVNMLAAMFLVHWEHGFGFSPPPGVEVNLIYIAMLLALILGGAGAFSVDEAVSRRAGAG